MEREHIKLALQSGSQRTPAGKWYNAALLVISCRPTCKLSCHVSPQQLWLNHPNTCTPGLSPFPTHARKHTHTHAHACTRTALLNLTRNIQSAQFIAKSAGKNWLAWMLLCFLAWVLRMSVWALSYRAGCLEQMVSSLLKGWKVGGGGGGFRAVAEPDSTGTTMAACLRRVNS